MHKWSGYGGEAPSHRRRRRRHIDKMQQVSIQGPNEQCVPVVGPGCSQLVGTSDLDEELLVPLDIRATCFFARTRWTLTHKVDLCGVCCGTRIGSSRSGVRNHLSGKRVSEPARRESGLIFVLPASQVRRSLDTARAGSRDDVARHLRVQM